MSTRTRAAGKTRLGCCGLTAASLVMGAATSALAQSASPVPASPSTSGLPALPPAPPPPEAEVSPARPPLAPPVLEQQPPPPSPAPTPQVPGTPAPAPESERTWYGWQILLIDGASLVLALAGANQSSQGGSPGPFMAGLGLIGYVGGGPTVHWAHGHVAKGFGSLGLRVGLPTAGFLLGLGLAATSPSSGDGTTALVDIGLGVVIGIIAAPIVDVAWLAWDDAPPPPPRDARSSMPPLRLTPIATIPRDTGGRLAPTVGLAGTF